ncbi:M61 family metallopeptidase [candidate division KSB1 bacterium]|nr:M61 family metallopeptidase [candidate division KSB1 bacterium]
MRTGKKYRMFSLLGIVIFTAWRGSLWAEERLYYKLSLDPEIQQRCHVELVVENVHRNRLVCSIPVWIPGSYVLEKLGDNIFNERAFDEENNPLVVTQLSKSDWEILTEGAQTVDFKYDVLIENSGFLGEGIDSTGALIQATAVWMYIRELEHLPASVTIEPLSGWRVATGLERQNRSLYTAPNYDVLADCPIMMGPLRDTTFVYRDVPHELYFRGKADFDLSAFARMVETVVAYQVDLFQDIPYNRYVFQYTLFPGYRSGGGLEHANSTSIGLSALKTMQDVRSAANITAHEFFHLWNVKRLTSDRLMPLHYDRDARMASLWWLEGVTSYYADLTLLRTGIWSVDEFLKNVSLEIMLLQQNPDRLSTTVSEASWYVWERGYHGPGISYYNKGQLIGLLLDVLVRKVTSNKKSLDNVLLYLYNIYAKQSRGFADSDIRGAVHKVTGKDFGSFFDRYITGLVEIPYRDILVHAGLDVNLTESSIPSIGRIRLVGEENRIFSLDYDCSAARNGIKRGDYLLSVNHRPFSGNDEFLEIIRNVNIGDTLDVQVRREGITLLFHVPVIGEKKVQCDIQVLTDASKEQLAIRNGLFQGITQ